MHQHTLLEDKHPPKLRVNVQVFFLVWCPKTGCAAFALFVQVKMEGYERLLGTELVETVAMWLEVVPWTVPKETQARVDTN